MLCLQVIRKRNHGLSCPADGINRPLNIVCELAPKSLFYTLNEGNEIPEGTFEISFNLTGCNETKRTMTLCKGESQSVLRSWYTPRIWVLIRRRYLLRLIPSSTSSIGSYSRDRLKQTDFVIFIQTIYLPFIGTITRTGTLALQGRVSKGNIVRRTKVS